MTATDSARRDPVRTRARILDAAERLFADAGIAAVPNRELLKAAGQRNESALQYHFGGRDGLIAALHERRMNQLETRRADGLEQLRAGDGPIAVSELARLQIETIMDLAREDPGFVDYLKILGEVVFTPRADLERFLGRFDITSNREVRRRVDQSLGHLSPDAIARRLDLGRRFLLMSLSRWAREEGEFSSPQAEALAADLIELIAAMFTAPEPSRTA